MEPHEERVVTEKNELDVRCISLSEFLTTAVFRNLPAVDRHLLTAQLWHMNAYSDTLGKRIVRFETPVDLPPKNMGFDDALKFLEGGYKVARVGWNVENMFVFLVQGSQFVVNRAPLLGIYPAGTGITYRAHIDIRNPDGSIGTWAPSNGDVLAKDWVVVDETTVASTVL